MRFVAWMADGTTVTGTDWSAVPEGVLVVRIWGHPLWGDLILWGLSHYGDPLTLRAGADVDDAVFQRALAAAQTMREYPGG